MERVRFVFDPLCPWCYQTSRWAEQLQRLGEVELEWGLFSLEVVNLEEGKDPRELVARSGPALRTAVLVRRRQGSKAIGALYTGIGRRYWEMAPPESDMASAVRAALTDMGVDPGWCDEAMADPSTWDDVVDEHRTFVERTRSFGVPTIVLDGGDGAAIFGPVVSELPSDDDAVELWRHTSWLARYGNFWELKRHRVRPPDLPAVEWRARQREAASAG
jgi:protein-disulfide isomerase-like protein with CxxC motif